MQKTIKKRFDLLVSVANKIVTKTFELDKTVIAIKGILITSDKDDLLYFRGSQKIEINREEFFPENYESKLLMSGINVPPRQRYYELDNVNPGNGTIKVDYKDEDDGRTPFIPYRVSIYLDCITQ